MSQSSLISDARWLDKLAERAGALVEDSNALSLTKLSAVEAEQIVAGELGAWPFVLEDASASNVGAGDITPHLEPYSLRFTKPEAPDGLVRFVTISGFLEWLNAGQASGIVEVCTATVSFETYGFLIRPWHSVETRQLNHAPFKSPQEVVRSVGPNGLQKDIRPWLADELTATQAADPVISAWVTSAAPTLINSLASEIGVDGQLIMRGPLNLRLDKPHGATANDLGLDGFRDLLAASRWVYESPRETDQRQGLFAHEMSRVAIARSDPGSIFAACAADALSGARIAYLLSLEGRIKDTQKALADLRKALTDETAKLSDATRQMTTAVAGAIAVGLGLIAARLSSNVSSLMLQALASVIALYVLAIVASGVIQTLQQKETRKEWRKRLYSFVPDDDYLKLVSNPAKAAELAFFVACGIVAAATAILVLAMFFGASVPVPPKG